MSKNYSFMSSRQKGKKSARQKLMGDLDRIASKLARNRDGNRCKVCGRPRVFAHHLFSRKYTGTRWYLPNLISLCHNCHRNAHTEPLQFHAWVKSWMTEYDLLQFKAYSITKFNESELTLLKRELNDP